MADSTALLKRRGGQTSPGVRIPPSPFLNHRSPQVASAGCLGRVRFMARRLPLGERQEIAYPKVDESLRDSKVPVTE